MPDMLSNRMSYAPWTYQTGPMSAWFCEKSPYSPSLNCFEKTYAVKQTFGLSVGRLPVLPAVGSNL